MAIVKSGDIKKVNETDCQAFDVYNGDWEALKSMMNEESVTEEKEEYKLNYK